VLSGCGTRDDERWRARKQLPSNTSYHHADAGQSSRSTDQTSTPISHAHSCQEAVLSRAFSNLALPFSLLSSTSNCHNKRIAQEGSYDRCDVFTQCRHGEVSAPLSQLQPQCSVYHFYILMPLGKSRSSPSTSARQPASKKSRPNVRPRDSRTHAAKAYNGAGKHVRACIVYTWDHKSSQSFWQGMKV
jgi:hypothetical protein